MNKRITPKVWRSARVLLCLMALTGLSAFGQHYTRVDLTTNATSVAPTAKNLDTNLVNAWGLARATGSPWWVADNGTGVSTLYDATGAPQPSPPLVVTIPLPKGQSGKAAPTGAVFNHTKAFEVGKDMPAIFIFVTEDGTISGWNPGVDPTNAVIKVDRSGKAIYKGCAIVVTPFGPLLYATNFKTGRIEVFDAKFHRINISSLTFSDPLLPKNYTPFNIQNVGGNLVVTFANREPGAEDENHGAGLGFVTIFSFDGRVLRRLQHGPWMNAPWGVAMAPGDFGTFSHRLLVGNFGDGNIHAFNALTGRFEGTLLGADNKAIKVDGLWSISFAGDSARSGLATDLYFTAGPNEEGDGLFGKISASADEQPGNSE